jgi:hypothetical protein
VPTATNGGSDSPDSGEGHGVKVGDLGSEYNSVWVLHGDGRANGVTGGWVIGEKKERQRESTGGGVGPWRRCRHVTYLGASTAEGEGRMGRGGVPEGEHQRIGVGSSAGRGDLARGARAKMKSARARSGSASGASP